jgi:hypothetical protein
MTDAITHQTLEGMAAELASAVECRRALTAALRRRLLEVADQMAPPLREAAAAERDYRAALLSAVQDMPELFAKPRTRQAHGIKYGWQTGKPSIEIPDEARTIKLIREKVDPAQAVLLIRVKESVDKKAVLDLTAKDLRLIGIRQVDGTDAPLVSIPKDGVDALVDALLAESTPQEAA